MTIPVPLGVRIKTGRATKRLTRELRSLSFRSAAPGGFASITFSLDRPLSLDPAEIGYYGNVYVEDLRNGMIVCEGRLEDPGRGVGSDGQVWELAAVGPAAHAQDKTVPRVYVDQDMSRLKRSGYTNTRAARVDYTDSEADPEIPAIDLTFPEGITVTSIAPASSISVLYRSIYDCGQQLGRVKATFDNGSTDGNRENRIRTRTTPTGSPTVAVSATFSTTPATLVCSRGGGNPITATNDVCELIVQIVAGGAVTVGTTAWAEAYSFLVRSLLKDINGADITSGYSQDYVTAAQVVTDMVGRGDLYLVDPTSSTIDTSGTAQIDQFAFPTGVTPAEVFDALMEHEAAFYWAIWESQASGKYRLEWKPWPSVIRYEADISGGFDSPGSAEGLYNEALVSYVDWRGRETTTIRTSSVADLTAAGLTRTIFVDLGSEANSLAAAQRAGDQALAEHASPPNAGMLTVSEPIYDLTLGRKVAPWEIRPGNLIRVRGVLPSVDTLNATARDAVTVFRVTAMEFDASTASARLELDSYPLNVAQALAKLARRRTRPRRAGAA